MSEGEKLEQIGKAMMAAWGRIKKSQARMWGDWMTIGEGLLEGRRWAMQMAGTNKPEGKGYVMAYAEWLKRFKVDDMDKSDRAKLLQLMEERPAVEEWRATLDRLRAAQSQQPGDRVAQVDGGDAGEEAQAAHGWRLRDRARPRPGHDRAAAGPRRGVGGGGAVRGGTGRLARTARPRATRGRKYSRGASHCDRGGAEVARSSRLSIQRPCAARKREPPRVSLFVSPVVASGVFLHDDPRALNFVEIKPGHGGPFAAAASGVNVSEISLRAQQHDAPAAFHPAGELGGGVFGGAAWGGMAVVLSRQGLSFSISISDARKHL